jgi:hypothetical protein
MLYAAKCYWPGVDERELARLSARALESAGASEPEHPAAYLGSLLFAADDLVLCLFAAESRAAVKRASDRLGIPCERVMDSVWLSPHAGAEPTQPGIPHPRRST